MKRPFRAWHKWKPEAVARLLWLHDERGMSFAEIGRELNRSTEACSNKYYYASCPAGAGQNKEPRANAQLLEQRDVRREASYRRDLTAELCGDPPPGYSALDQKQKVTA